MKIKLEQPNPGIPLYYVIAWKDHVEFPVENDIPEGFQNTILMVGNPAYFILQIFWEGKVPRPNSQKRNFVLIEVIEKVAEIADVSLIDKYIGVGHIPEEAIEKFDIWEDK